MSWRAKGKQRVEQEEIRREAPNLMRSFWSGHMSLRRFFISPILALFFILFVKWCFLGNLVKVSFFVLVGWKCD